MAIRSTVVGTERDEKRDFPIESDFERFAGDGGESEVLIFGGLGESEEFGVSHLAFSLSSR